MGGTLNFPQNSNQHPAAVGAESEDIMQEKKDIYKQLLIDMSDQMAALLADGKAIEIDRSRSGLKLYSFRRKHEVVQKQKNEATPNRK